MDRAVAERMREHVIAVADEHGITLHWTKRWRDALAYPEAKTAVVPEIRHPHDYLFALHEIGHIVSPDALALLDDFDTYSTVLSEGAAWAWATATARPVLTRTLRAKDWDTVAYAFRTYLEVHGRRGRRTPSSQEVPTRSVRHSGSTAIAS